MRGGLTVVFFHSLIKISVLLLLFVSSTLLAQTITPVPPTTGHLGYLEYLPPSYSSTTEKYPCIIFLHGAGEIGNGLEPDIWKVATHGTFKEIKVNKHSMCFTVNGKQECFIVIGPQVKSTVGISEAEFLNIYNHIMNTYRIDPARVYLTGLSMGGEGSYRRAGDPLNTPNVIAALGIMSASIGCGTAQNVGAKNIPIWAHHGDQDNSFHSYAKALATMDCINNMNPNPPPIFTVYPGLGHSGTLWSQAYSGSHTYHNPNLYEWFLSYRLNQLVKVVLGPDKSITLPVNSTTLNSTVTSTNPVQTYAWTKQAGPAATLNDANTQTLTASSLVQGTYVFRLTVTDNKGNSAFDDITVIVQPAAVNQPPVANAGADKLIALPTNTAVFNGTGSDADGTVASYSWVKVSGPAATLTNQNVASLTASNLVAGAYVFGLTVRDDDGATGYDEVRLTVEATNLKPTVNAGPDKTIELPTNSVVLSGTASDQDGSIVKYNWIKQSGPIASIQNNYTANLTLTNLLQGTYVFRLWVKDNDSTAVWDEVKVTVNAANALPVTNNLVGHWSLDNCTTDDSGNEYHGTNMNGASFTAVCIEGSHDLKLNGANQYIDLGNPGLPSGKSPRSITLWAKTNDIPDNYRFAVSYGKAVYSGAMIIGQKGKDLYGGSYGNDLMVKDFWDVGDWHHIALTYDGITAKMYADGMEVIVATKNWNLVLDKAYIGRQVNGLQYWNGEIDDVRIYNDALSGDEVNLIYSASVSNARISSSIETTKAISKNLENIKVYPVPTNGNLHVHVPLTINSENGTLKLSIYNLLGLEVFNQLLETNITNDIDITHLSSNVYIITITCEDKIILKNKLIKN
jgi:hypothetical protein